MPNHKTLSYAATGAFSHTVVQYLEGVPELKPFYTFGTDKAGMQAAITARTKKPVDRTALVTVLEDQYRQLPHIKEAAANILKLNDANTFTVCTAHQPNLATGYLYFVYKILHAVKLANDLNKDFPDKHFVPVYYMGSEDADLEELGTFRYGNRKFVWDAAGQKGAVGNMRTDSLKPLLDELFGVMGPPGEPMAELQHLLKEAYLNHDTVAAATQYLVHMLFGKYGLVVLNPDDARLKRSFIEIMKEDLLEHTAETLVRAGITALTSAGYKPQAHPRSINLFYLKDNIRQRIEQRGDDEWIVLDTEISFNKKTLLDELRNHPGRFSPNVILRPLYQETILPDVAFIGGGSEVAYWLQLKELFAHASVYLPAIILRQSFLWIDEAAAALRAKTGLEPETLFNEEEEIVKRYVLQLHGAASFTGTAPADVAAILAKLKEQAVAIDITLGRSAAAVLKKIQYQIDVLEGKMLRAEKRKHQMAADRIYRLRAALFPGGSLQERSENFMPYYLRYGAAFFDALLEAMPPSYEHQFVVIEA